MNNLLSEKGSTILQIIIGLGIIAIIVGVIGLSTDLSNRLRGHQRKSQALRPVERQIRLVLSQISNCVCNFKYIDGIPERSAFRFPADLAKDIPVGRIKTYARPDCIDTPSDTVLAEKGKTIGDVSFTDIKLQNLTRILDSAAYRADLTITGDTKLNGVTLYLRQTAIPLRFVADVFQGEAKIESCQLDE